MQRLRVRGEPEAVFEALQTRLREIGATPRLVDPASITLLFDVDTSARGVPSTFFLAVVPVGSGESDIALARKRKGPRNDFRAMVIGDSDPLEEKVLRLLSTPGAR